MERIREEKSTFHAATEWRVFLPESFEDEKEADGVNEQGLWRFPALDFPRIFPNIFRAFSSFC